MSEEITGQKLAKVLVVDDNDINRFLAKKVLSKWNIHTDFADNGETALEMIRSNQYDVVLMDIHMPIMGGLKAVQHIRAMDEERFKNLPVIALTASVMGRDIDEIKNSGMTDFVLKPFVPDELFAKLKPFINSRLP
jgi:CheY-like chemotaxis protein